MQSNIEVTHSSAGSLATFLAGPVVNRDEVLSDLLVKAEALRDSPLLIFDFSQQRTLHVGDGLLALCGYSAQESCNGKADFILNLTCPDDIPYLMLLQQGYIQEAKATGFDPSSLRIHDYYWSMLHRNGTKVPVVSTGIVLTYSPQNDFHIGVGFHVLNDKDCDSRLLQCKELMRQIKHRHNQIHRHMMGSGGTALYPIHHVNTTRETITLRERQVLGMLAQGHSTETIAETLAIAANTVESHRKKLLQKFGARNCAELIKKASKVFWLS